MAEQSSEHFTRFTAKYCLMARTACRRTTCAIWSKLADRTDFYLLNFPIKMHYRYELSVNRRVKEALPSIKIGLIL